MNLVKMINEEKQLNELLENDWKGFINSVADQDDARFLLEYTIVNGYGEQHDYLLEVLSGSDNEVTQEWVTVYNIDRQSSKKELTTEETLHKLDELELKTDDMRMYSEIAKLYVNYDMKNFNDMMKIVSNIEKNVYSLATDFLKRNYQLRVSMNMMSVYTSKNMLKKARMHCNFVLNNSLNDKMTGIAFLQLGNSYTFDSMEMSLDYLYKSLELLKGTDVNHHVERSVVFVRNYWGLPNAKLLNGDSGDSEDINEVVYSLINKGYEMYAEEMLESVDVSTLNEYQKGFHFYLKSMITLDESDLDLSMNCFESIGELFYVQMVENRRKEERLKYRKNYA